MALLDMDSWVTEYDSCERLGHSIQSQIYQRDQQQSLSTEYSKISANIRLRLKQFENELDQLKLKVSSRYQNITDEELERRLRQTETLQSQLFHLQKRFKSVPPGQTTDRNILIPSTASQLWEDEDVEPLLKEPDIQTMRQEQIQIMEDQNKGLEALSETISRQKQLASRMGQEVEEQNEILDDIADTMERVDARVNRETRNIDDISQQDSVWSYWTVIVLLFIAIVILLFV